MIYIAGPLSDPDPAVREQRIATAEAAFLLLLEAGVPAICRHLAGRIPGVWEPDFPITHRQWVQNGLAQLRACRLILLLRGWERSVGAREEYLEAQRCGIPPVHTLQECTVHVRRPITDPLWGKLRAFDRTQGSFVALAKPWPTLEDLSDV